MDAFEAISLPDSSTLSCRKRFSLAEANRSLTLVRRIVADIVREYGRLRELHSSCRLHEAEGDTVRAEEARGRYVQVTDRLSALREELEEIGCELKDYANGLVDFPARLHGRDVLLCWMLGEDKVAWWHEVEAGANGRQPVGSEWD
jgi:hypothetical protein